MLHAEQWELAHQQREALLDFIKDASGAGEVHPFPCAICCWGPPCSSVHSPAASLVLTSALKNSQQMCDMLESLHVALSAVVPGNCLLEFLLILRQNSAGTMLDPRRTRDYDADHLVDDYLNQPEVKVGHGLSAWTAHCTADAQQRLLARKVARCCLAA